MKKHFEPYRLDSQYKRAVCYYCSVSPKFWSRIGRHFDSAGFVEPITKLIIECAHIVSETNQGNGSSSVASVVQVAENLCDEGQITIDTLVSLRAYYFAVSPIPPEEEVANILTGMIKRRLKSDTLEKLLLNPDGDGGVERARAELDKIARIGQGSHIETVSPGSGYFQAVVDAQRANRLPTPCAALTTLMKGGPAKGELAMVAADSGTGKSLYLDNQAAVAITLGFKTALISNELSILDHQGRILSYLTGHSLSQWLEHPDELPPDVLSRFHQLEDTGVLDRLRITRLEDGHTWSEVVEWIEAEEKASGEEFDLIIVDYPDRMSANTSREKASGHWSVASDTWGLMRNYVENKKCWMWIATQPKNKTEGRGIIRKEHLSESVYKARLVHWGVSINLPEGEEGVADSYLYHVFKATSGIDGITSSPIPHQKHVGRIAPAPIGLNLPNAMV